MTFTNSFYQVTEIAGQETILGENNHGMTSPVSIPSSCHLLFLQGV